MAQGKHHIVFHRMMGVGITSFLRQRKEFSDGCAPWSTAAKRKLEKSSSQWVNKRTLKFRGAKLESYGKQTE